MYECVLYRLYRVHGLLREDRGELEYPVANAEVERVERRVPDVAEAQRDDVAPAPEHLLEPAHPAIGDRSLRGEVEPGHPVEARELRLPGDADERDRLRAPGQPFRPGERDERRLAQVAATRRARPR